MDEDTRIAIDALTRKLNPLIEKEKNYKRLINELHMDAGEPAPFPDVESMGGGLIAIAPDQYYMKGLVPSVRHYLKMKGKAAPTKEIFEALKKGGFEFEGKDEKLHYRGFAIALSKRRETFASIPNSDSYGLREWYPELKDEKKPKAASAKNGTPQQTPPENDSADEETEPEEAGPEEISYDETE